MNLFHPYILLLLLFLSSSIASGRTYFPIGEVNSSESIFLPVKTQDRPFLAGMRPVEEELLVDALKRKCPRLIRDCSIKAREKILRSWLNSNQTAQIKGQFAEALFLKNNHNWGYVSSPNASQHDLYTWIRGRKTPFTAQSKALGSPNPKNYAAEMEADHRSNLFLVPDDHVDGLKEYWRREIKDRESRGLLEEAIQARKQMARVRGLGFTTSKLTASYNKAVERVIRERQAGYVSLGVAIAMTFGPDLWDGIYTGSLPSQATSRWARAGAVTGTGALTSYALTRISDGAWQGTWKGNALVGSTMLLPDVIFEVQDYGGFKQAFNNPDFYCIMTGKIGGSTLAMATFTPVAWYTTAWSIETGPWAPIIGGTAGTAASVGAYMLGSMASENCVRAILDKVNPDLLHRAEKNRIVDVKDDISKKISSIKTGYPLSILEGNANSL